MTATEIRDKVKALIEAWTGVGAYLGETQYKSQFFALCHEAQKARYHTSDAWPRLSADALQAWIIEQWAMAGAATPKRRESLRIVCDNWREWLYALDRC
jgi:hypothetical protein